MEETEKSSIENDEFTCPITLEPFRDPVIAADGRIYEREAITKWILENGTSPFTRQPLRITDLQSDEKLRQLAAHRRNSTVSYSARDGVVTLPPLRRVRRNNSQVAPNIVARAQASYKCSGSCIVIIACVLGCLGMCALSIGLPIALAAASQSDVTTWYSSALNYNSTMFSRLGRGRFYYEAIQVTVIIAGTYTFRSVSKMDTYGYLYIDSFNTSSLSTNLLAENDDGAGSLQFRISNWLTDQSAYILVVTTASPRDRGGFLINVIGPARVILR